MSEKPPTRVCTVNYRRLSHDESCSIPDDDLKSLISQAMKGDIEGKNVFKHPNVRRYTPEDGVASTRFINICQSHENFICGDLCVYYPGRLQTVISPSDEDVSWAIEQQKADDGKEFVQAHLPWLAIGDHFYYIGSNFTPPSVIESYFTWLLSRTGVITNASKIVLQSQFDFTQPDGSFGIGELKKIRIGGYVAETGKKRDLVGDIKPIAERRKVLSESKNILQRLFGDTSIERAINDMPDESLLEVSVEIGLHSSIRKQSTAVLRDLEEGLRNLPDGEITLIGSNGKSTNGEVRLSERVSVALAQEIGNGSLLDFKSAIEKMLEVHQRFVNGGKIV